MSQQRPVVLIPGYWLGGWAWSAVAGQLRSEGFAVTALTLPGLESVDTDRGEVSFTDHVDAVLEILPPDEPAVLVAHSGAGAVATGVLDRAPERIARVVYVDSGPAADGEVARPDLPAGADLPFPSWDEFRSQLPSMLDGLGPEELVEFRSKVVPHPGRVVAEPVSFINPARNDVPATAICCCFDSATVSAGQLPMFSTMQDLTDLTYRDLPTGHWPMWSEPEALGNLIAEAARG